MIYKLKQKIRHSKWGDTTARWVEKTPLFLPCWALVNWLGMAELSDVMGASKEEISRYFNSHQKEIETIVSHLADEKSKEVFKKIISLRCKGNQLYKGTPADQYFPKDVIALSNEEVFVDCGAYTGDTIAHFCEIVQNQYKKIVAFEPDLASFHKLQALHIPRCVAFPCGVWNKKETLLFYANGKGNSTVAPNYKGQTNLTESQKITIPVVPLDEIPECADMTFLKMDLEGSELNALKGAEKTIRKQHPKMAICIYHSDQDMLEIPLWVLSLNMGYKLYIRHHGEYNLAETVLYAI